MFDLFARFILDNVGGRLVLPDNCVLPERCAVCNKLAPGEARRLRLRCSAVGSGYTRYTIYLHLCGWHAVRRRLLLLVAGVAVAVCGVVVNGKQAGHKPTGLQLAAICGLIVAGLIFINLVLNDPFFRGLHLERGGMAIKGFGRRFRESLRAEEIIVLEPGQTPAEAGRR